MACDGDFNVSFDHGSIIFYCMDGDLNFTYGGEPTTIKHYGDDRNLITTNRYMGCNVRASGIYTTTISNAVETVTINVDVSPERWFSQEYTNVNYPDEVVPIGGVVANLEYFGSNTSLAVTSTRLKKISDPDLEDWRQTVAFSDDMNQLIAFKGLNGYENPIVKIDAQIGLEQENSGDNRDMMHWDSTYVTINIPRNIPLDTSLVPLPHENMHDITLSLYDTQPTGKIADIIFDVKGSGYSYSFSNGSKLRAEGYELFLDEVLDPGTYTYSTTMTMVGTVSTLTCTVTINVTEASAPDLSGWALSDDTIDENGDQTLVLTTNTETTNVLSQTVSHDDWFNTQWLGHPTFSGIGNYNLNVNQELISDGDFFTITLTNVKGTDSKDFVIHRSKPTANIVRYTNIAETNHLDAGATVAVLNIDTTWGDPVITFLPDEVTRKGVATTGIELVLDNNTITTTNAITFNCEDWISFRVFAETDTHIHNASCNVYNIVEPPSVDPCLMYIDEGLPVGTVIGNIGNFITASNGCDDYDFYIVDNGSQNYNPNINTNSNDIVSINTSNGEITSKIVFDFNTENQYDFNIEVDNKGENGFAFVDVSISVNQV
jgi:hypothetical protein